MPRSFSHRKPACRPIRGAQRHRRVVDNKTLAARVFEEEQLALPDAVLQSLKQTGHELVSLTYDQMDAFAGNMLELRTSTDARVIAMSEQARQSLTEEQLEIIANHATIISAPIDEIEKSSGGSVRCMLAEIHLQKTVDDGHA